VGSLGAESGFLGQAPASLTPTRAPPDDRADGRLTVPQRLAVAVHPAFGGGASFGRYQLLDAPVRGGMGMVYRAFDTELGRVVALKMLLGGDLTTRDEQARFRREAQAVAQLSHPNVVPLLETGHQHGRAYLTMPFISGGNLASRKERYQEDARAAVCLIEKVARAADYAHRRGVVHRDLKPANILLDERGEPLLADFGLAKLLDSGVEITRSGALVGTPAYMAPEQADVRLGPVGPAADVWALGVILYELLTGRRPFPGQGREEVLARVGREEPPPLRAVNPALDPWLEGIVRSCLEKTPARRLASAGMLAEQLHAWLEGEASRTLPPVPPRTAQRAGRRRLVLALGALLTVVVTVFAASTSRRSASPVAGESLPQLSPDKPTALVGDTGLPRWKPEWLLGQDTGRTAIGREGMFTLTAWRNPSLLQLLPAVPFPRYRFTAWVCHEASEGFEGEVGLYFAHHRQPTERGLAHLFVQVSYNDVTPSKSYVRMRPYVVYLGGQALEFDQHRAGGVSLRFGDQAGPGMKKWRLLAVEVTPEAVAGTWEDAPLGVVTTEKVTAGTANGLRELGRRHPDDARLPTLTVAPDYGGGLGLYVRGGAASFRSVSIEPLSQ
jgi:hypothetical protein